MNLYTHKCIHTTQRTGEVGDSGHVGSNLMGCTWEHAIALPHTQWLVAMASTCYHCSSRINCNSDVPILNFNLLVYIDLLPASCCEVRSPQKTSRHEYLITFSSSRRLHCDKTLIQMNGREHGVLKHTFACPVHSLSIQYIACPVHSLSIQYIACPSST